MDNLKLYGKKQSETKGPVSTGVVFNEEIGMEFGFKKHSAITMDREKFNSKDEIELPSSEKIRQIGRLRHMKNKGVQLSHALACDSRHKTERLQTCEKLHTTHQAGMWWRAMIIPFRTP